MKECFGPALYMNLHLSPSTLSGAAAGVSANAMTGRRVVLGLLDDDERGAWYNCNARNASVPDACLAITASPGRFAAHSARCSERRWDVFLVTFFALPFQREISTRQRQETTGD